MIGTICYTTNSGLGILAKAFYDHGIVNRILAIRHPHYQSHPEWYKCSDLFIRSQERQFLSGLKTLLLFENAFNCWSTVKAAKARGICTVMMPMYEYTPKPLPVPVDHYICPSLLDMQYYEGFSSTFIPVPVEKPWRLRRRAEVFVHNAGHGGKNFRNGTPELLEAMQYVKSPIQLIVRAQPGDQGLRELFSKYRNDPRIKFVLGDVPDHELWFTGDVFIFPEKFNGLSLPLQEAYASGMLVMGTNRFPINTWLPINPLIPVKEYRDDTLAVHFKSAVINPVTVAATIDAWYNRDITEYSMHGKAWAQEHSWEKLIPKYKIILE